MNESVEMQILNKLSELDEKIDEKIELLRQELNQKHEDLKEELNTKYESLEKQLLDRQFLFEHEYGTKISAIFDAVMLEKDKNIEKTQKLKRLDNRVERTELQIFDHERRISNLEMKNFNTEVVKSK